MTTVDAAGEDVTLVSGQLPVTNDVQELPANATPLNPKETVASEDCAQSSGSERLRSTGVEKQGAGGTHSI